LTGTDGAAATAGKSLPGSARPELRRAWEELANDCEQRLETRRLTRREFSQFARRIQEFRRQCNERNQWIDSRTFERLIGELQKVIVGSGRSWSSDCGLSGGGHVLIEGVPGLAKTLFAKALGTP